MAAAFAAGTAAVLSRFVGLRPGGVLVLLVVAGCVSGLLADVRLSSELGADLPEGPVTMDVRTVSGDIDLAFRIRKARNAAIRSETGDVVLRVNEKLSFEGWATSSPKTPKSWPS